MDKVKGKTTLLYPLIVGIFLTILITGYWAGTKKAIAPRVSPPMSPQITPYPTPTPDLYTESSRSTTANWKTYANNKYQYEVKYPSDWEIVDAHTSENVTFGDKESMDKKPPLISVHVFETAKFRTQDIPNYTPFDYKIIENNGYTFFIVASTYQIGAAAASKETEQEAKIMLTKILSTFQFTD